MTPLHSVERELLLHADALRALALDLVGASSADDLLQETAMHALRSPPPEPQRLFAWLATILRNAARKQRRTQRRRATRERLAARDEALPPSDALVERRDMLRRVTDAVLALPEPYQATLLRRYFEELTPSAIARRDGVPLATVKSRLQRGRALLRAQLERERGDWRRALLGLTGITALPPATGVLLMTTTTKVLAGAAAGLLATMLWLTFAGHDASPPLRGSLASASLAGGASAVGVGGIAPLQDAVARTEVTPPPAPGADLTHPYSFELQCRVVDRLGLPVSDARIFFAPRSTTLNVWPDSTDADGRATLRWRGKQPQMTMAIGVRPSHAGEELQEVVVRAGAPRQLTLLSDREPAVELVLTAGEASGKLAATPRVGSPACPNAAPRSDCRSCHAEPRLRSLFEGSLTARSGLHPDATFADLLLPKPPDPVEQWSEGEWEATIGLGRGTRAPATHLAGVVYGADGKPAAGVPLVWIGGGAGGRTRTAADGTFEVHGMPPGRIAIHAGGGDAGLATATVEIGDGDTVQRDLVLDLGSVVRGRALGADGEPLAGWRVEYVGDSWCDACAVHDDGRFVLPNLPAGPGTLLLWGRHGSALPVAIEPSVLPDSGEVRFDLRRRGAPHGELRLAVALPDGVDRGEAEVRVWQQDSGRCAAMQLQRDRSFALTGLTAGFYRIEIGSVPCGWRDLGAQWVDGGGLVDLGRVELPQPGHLRLTCGADVDGRPELDLRRSDCDVRAEDGDAVGADDLRIPAGTWLCLWKTKAGALGSRTFTVRSGAVTEVTIGEAPSPVTPPRRPGTDAGSPPTSPAKPARSR